ncbi:Uncharacterised protein [uncultured archaeon]|nr:Uncharacterised protein [uncultured archaeon]
MAYADAPIKRQDNDGAVRNEHYGYNECIDKAKVARNNQFKDTDPMVEKEGFLGVDDLDKMRRRKVR